MLTAHSHSAEEIASHLDPDYCGSCFSANAPPSATKAGCCNTCDEVREAYAGMGWAFGRGEGVEQCEREHYGERLDAQRNEGCRIEGNLRVNKVVGNFHIAPGRSFSNGNMHVHDLNNYFDTPVEQGHTFTHKIHQLRFGPQVPSELSQNLGSQLEWTNHHLNPLDNTDQATSDAAYNFMYFVKVVSTSYLPLGARKTIADQYSDTSPLGSHGVNSDGSLETHQYSVTSHKRSLSGGSDAKEGHKERVHARGGIPGVFFSYVSALRPSPISPDRETAGYLADEGHQPRRARQISRRLPHGHLRRHRRHSYSRGCRRQRRVRRHEQNQEAAPKVARSVQKKKIGVSHVRIRVHRDLVY